MTGRISARLRALSYHIDETGLADDVDAKSCTEAADHIDAQAATIKALVEALEPFSEAAEIKLCGEWRDDESIQKTDVAFHIKFGDLRSARKALEAVGGKT